MLRKKEPETEAIVFAEQVALLFKNAPLVYTVTIINGALLVFVEYPYADSRSLLIWFICLTSLTVLRVLLVFYYYQRELTGLKIQFWYKMYLVGTGLAGLVWFGGAAQFIFFLLIRSVPRILWS